MQVQRVKEILESQGYTTEKSPSDNTMEVSSDKHVGQFEVTSVKASEGWKEETNCQLKVSLLMY